MSQGFLYVIGFLPYTLVTTAVSVSQYTSDIRRASCILPFAIPCRTTVVTDYVLYATCYALVTIAMLCYPLVAIAMLCNVKRAKLGGVFENVQSLCNREKFNQTSQPLRDNSRESSDWLIIPSERLMC